MAQVRVNGTTDMPAFDISTISNGTITQNTSSVVKVSATDDSTYTFQGSFTGGEGSTFPTGGTITRWVQQSGANSVVIGGLSLPVADFDHFMQTGNSAGLMNEILAGNDVFNLQATDGTANVFGAAGNDRFSFGGAFAATDTVDGGGGANTVDLNGDYSAGLTLSDTTLTNIDRLVLAGASSYDLTMADGNVAADRTMVVDATKIGGGSSLTFDGSAETDGRYIFFLGGASNLSVIGSAGNDVFHGGGTAAELSGGAGNDKFAFGGNFDGTDSINGGSGYNVVTLRGDYSAGLTFGANALTNIDKVILEPGGDYNLTLNAANDAVGHTLKMDGHTLRSVDTLTIDGSAAAGTLILDGGGADDTLTGGSGTNVFKGGSGDDQLIAGSGADHFIYTSPLQSTGAHHDTVTGFDADTDGFTVHAAVTGIDIAVTSGALSTASFNGDLGRALGSGQLGAHHAVLFTATSGDQAGVTYLVVDQNGVAGYQSIQDLVIRLDGATHLADLSSGDFTQGN